MRAKGSISVRVGAVMPFKRSPQFTQYAAKSAICTTVVKSLCTKKGSGTTRALR